MYKYFPVSAASRMSLALVIVMTSGLAACSSGELALDDTYVPATHYERYPIKVTRGPVRMDVSTRDGTLQDRPGLRYCVPRLAAHPERLRAKPISCSCRAAYRPA